MKSQQPRKASKGSRKGSRRSAPSPSGKGSRKGSRRSAPSPSGKGGHRGTAASAAKDVIRAEPSPAPSRKSISARKGGAHGGGARSVASTGARFASKGVGSCGGRTGKQQGTEHLCPVSGICGGCSAIEVPYDEQLQSKQRRTEEIFADTVPSELIRPIIGMEDPFHYRNKVTSPYAPASKSWNAKRAAKGVGKGPDVSGCEGADMRTPKAPAMQACKAPGTQASKGAAARMSARAVRGQAHGRPGAGATHSIATGMYCAGSHKLVPADSCLVENERAKAVTLAIRDIMERYGMEPYDEDTGTGFVRHAVIRVGHTSGEVLVTLVTNGEEFPASKSFCRELVKRCPYITSVVQNINTRQTNVIFGEGERRLYGPGFILDELCGLSFRISSKSFYQVNAVQTAILYDAAIGLADLGPHSTVIDAYCGTGTIGLAAAKRSGAALMGIDSVASAIADARQNAAHNGMDRAEFIVGDAGEVLQDLAASGSADAQHLTVFMDPPRSGSTEKFMDALARLGPETVVYISCNPQTQARDLRYLRTCGYRVDALQPVDMFPHTDHIETVALLKRAANPASRR